LNVSVLGCVVNGIGEGKEADIGIAGGEGVGILFKHGKLIRKVKSEELLDTLLYEIEIMAKEKEADLYGEANGSVDGDPVAEPISLTGDTKKKEIPLLKL
jgi:(E)-4-hydroxy-3-methylbut-2-enyl-diphosphate synthase